MHCSQPNSGLFCELLSLNPKVCVSKREGGSFYSHRKGEGSFADDKASHTYSDIYTYSRAHARTHARMHARAPKHTHIHTQHTHTRAIPFPRATSSSITPRQPRYFLSQALAPYDPRRCVVVDTEKQGSVRFLVRDLLWNDAPGCGKRFGHFGSETPWLIIHLAGDHRIFLISISISIYPFFSLSFLSLSLGSLFLHVYPARQKG